MYISKHITCIAPYNTDNDWAGMCPFLVTINNKYTLVNLHNNCKSLAPLPETFTGVLTDKVHKGHWYCSNCSVDWGLPFLFFQQYAQQNYLQASIVFHY